MSTIHDLILFRERVELEEEKAREAETLARHSLEGAEQDHIEASTRLEAARRAVERAEREIACRKTGADPS